ncbi:hypothetical protein JOB18_007347 [Solea senegalensis]|uniref:Uncharacterized protein n=1 Tax=Solea senegalensis TaxID=28829 RepID=A0AAV6S4F3_SOLSE|nr:hypothetical protein JOB18_007347 [Solea senegalensis]
MLNIHSECEGETSTSTLSTLTWQQETCQPYSAAPTTWQPSSGVHISNLQIYRDDLKKLSEEKEPARKRVKDQGPGSSRTLVKLLQKPPRSSSCHRHSA